MGQALKLKGHLTFTGELVCRTGIRIGGSKEELKIGGLDLPVIRDPIDDLPYLPGSSLKGKLRSLLEYKYNKVGPDGTPCNCAQPDCPVCRLFGPHNQKMHDLGPSRLIVRDSLLSEESKRQIEVLAEGPLGLAENKTEVMIDRRTGIARHGGLRTIERIPKGTVFDLNMSLRVFEGDSADRMVDLVQEALALLQSDYLGGSGTRGYGWMAVRNCHVTNASTTLSIDHETVSGNS